MIQDATERRLKGI